MDSLLIADGSELITSDDALSGSLKEKFQKPPVPENIDSTPIVSDLKAESMFTDFFMSFSLPKVVFSWIGNQDFLK